MQDVTTSEGRLRRQFPGPSAVVTSSHIGDATFREPLTDALAKLDREKTLKPQPTDDTEFMQDVETAHPRLVTETIMGIIRGVGENATVSGLQPTSICKNVREEAMGSTSSPWRRSALWLLLRVSIQLTMERAHQQEDSPRDIYKEFMAFFLCQTLGQATALSLPHDTLFMMLTKVSRRILKLGLSEAPWLHTADMILQDTRRTLETFWALVQEKDRDVLDFSALASLDFAADTDLALKTLRPYLEKVSSGLPLSSDAHATEVDDHNPRMNDKQSLPHTEFHTYNTSLLLYELADFEGWVELHLNDHATSRPDAHASAGDLSLQSGLSTLSGEPE